MKQLSQLAVEISPFGYIARCSIPDCLQRATATLFYLDDQERFYCQTDACDGHMNQLCAGLKVIERGQHPDA
jgi:hypothetical protein